MIGINKLEERSKEFKIGVHLPTHGKTVVRVAGKTIVRTVGCGADPSPIRKLKPIQTCRLFCVPDLLENLNDSLWKIHFEREFRIMFDVFAWVVY